MGEKILRLLRGTKDRFPVLTVLTNRRLLIISQSLDVVSYVLTDVILFAITPYPRSLMDKLFGKHDDYSMLYVKDDAGYSSIDVWAEDGERFEAHFRRARSLANMSAG